MPHSLLVLKGNWVYVYPDGRVPLPVLRRLFVVSFLRLGLERLVLLLRHFHHSVLRLLQLSTFLGGALPSPAHLQTAHNTWMYDKMEEVSVVQFQSTHIWFVDWIMTVSVMHVFLSACHLHPLDPADSSSSVIWSVHSGPLLLGQAVFIIWLLKHIITQRVTFFISYILWYH